GYLCLVFAWPDGPGPGRQGGESHCLGCLNDLLRVLERQRIVFPKSLFGLLEEGVEFFHAGHSEKGKEIGKEGRERSPPPRSRSGVDVGGSATASRGCR